MNFKRFICRKEVIIPLSVVLALALVFAILCLGEAYNAKSEIHWTPDYEKTDIQPLLEKSELTEDDYALLFEQTGLTKIGIDDLLSVGDTDRILTIQSNYFEEQIPINEKFAPFSQLQLIGGRTTLTNLEDGDIIVSSSTFVSWFRCGHAAIVVDGGKGLLLNAVTPGENSIIVGLSEFNSRANFMVLRPKLSKEERAAAAAYAKENLKDKPYDLAVGLLSKKYKEEIRGTHCAHSVFAAYKSIGIDLDSNGGAVVTPKDIANSEHLELVQTFGFNPEKYWK